MLTLQWFTTGAAVLVALVAFFRARRVSRRLDRLAESYWELRYEYGQLRARIGQLEPGSPEGARPEQPDGAAGREGGRTSFVPLSSLKR